ncbi:hypothetical protein ACWD04_10740 [Streptomyces sp. NPDC002911]
MEPDGMLALFEREMREHARPDGPGTRVERVGDVVRQTGGPDDWNGVVWTAMHPGTGFAGLWGGGTSAPWRGKGIHRALIARRARLAAGLGYRFLQVDATDQSAPILRRLGFTALSTTTPYVYRTAPRHG